MPCAPAIVQRLGIADADLLDYTIFRRGYDAQEIRHPVRLFD